MYFRFWVFAGVVLLLSGCVANEPGSVSDVHIGTRSHYSKQVRAAGGLLWDLSARAVATERDGHVIYGLNTQYVSTGLGWAFLERAWSFGVPLPYEVNDRKVSICSTGGCTLEELGTILLTRKQFLQFARTGMEFKLEGKRGSVVGKVGPEVFQQVLDLRQ